MKKLLPNTINTKGFTLVELLVVVAIIAILAVIGFAVFTGIQARARDDARRSDIDAISKALEVNKTNAGYQPLQNSIFANGTLPATDPQGIVYCLEVPKTTSTVATAGWTTSACPGSLALVSTSVPAANSASWRVCTLLEGPPATVYCRGSAQ